MALAAEEKELLPDAAQKLANQLVSRVSSEYSGRRCSVTVFPFGNAKGQYTKQQGNVPIAIQGELLKKFHNSNYPNLSINGPEALKELCLKNKLDTVAVSATSTKAVAEFLTAAKLDAAVVGDCEPPSSSIKSLGTELIA